MLKKLKEIRSTILKAVDNSKFTYEDINEGILVDAYNFECIFEGSFDFSFKYKYYRGVSSKKHTILIKFSQGYTCYTYDRDNVHFATIDEVYAFIEFFFDFCKTIILFTTKLDGIVSTYEMSVSDMRKYQIDKILSSDT